MRGRRPDPASQEIKGNPGKRRKQPSIAERVKLLSEAPAAEALAPPSIFGLEEFEGAIKIWREFAPVLDRRNILDKLDRHTLAMFCYYLDRFWSAVGEIAATGETQKVKTIAGGFMLRDHPAVRRRDDAYKFVTDLSKSFGFTPLDRNKLIREMAGAGAPIGGLFAEGNAPTPSAPSAEDADDITGFASRVLQSGSRPN